MKGNKDEYLKEMQFIKDWIIFMLDFLKEKDANWADFGGSTRKAFDTPVPINKQVLIGYRQGFRDMNEMAEALSPNDYKELNKLLFEKFGKTIDDFNSKKARKINTIVKRKKIKNDEEYSLIEEKVSELSQQLNNQKEIDDLNRLIVDYHKKTKLT